MENKMTSYGEGDVLRLNEVVVVCMYVCTRVSIHDTCSYYTLLEEERNFLEINKK